MNKGIKTVLCVTTALALMAGLVTGCKVTKGDKAASGDAAEEASSSIGDSITVPVETSEETSEPKPGDYRSVKEYYNGEVPDKGVLGEYEFEIGIAGSFGMMKSNSGYFVETSEGSDPTVYIVICSGEKSTTGYDINIVDIGLQDGEFRITVEETSPVPGSTVGDAMTYPYCTLILNKLPEKYKVYNTKGYEFPEYDSIDEATRENLSFKDPRFLIKDYPIPDGWIASLRDGAGEIMYETFIYRDGTGYKYINIISVTESWGATKWNNRFHSEGTSSTKDEVLKAAKDFGSAGFMVLPDDLMKTYSVDDFIKMDL